MNVFELFYWLKLKIIFVTIIIFIFITKNSLFIKKKCQNIYFLIEQQAYFEMYLKIKNIFEQNNISIIERNKKQYILNLLSYHNRTNKTSIDKLFYKTDLRFGNLLVTLNKLIFYCEIIGCKSIILDKNDFWFINNKIYIPNKKISIETGNYNNSFNFYFTGWTLLFSNSIYRPKIRINYLRKEIISNLPKIHHSKDYLYIHIRSGDIFSLAHPFYSQPPLCFYQLILNNYNFSKIYLISENKNNPIIEKLINQYSSINYCKNNIKLDISLLINAYKLVASISSFVNLIIQLNYNLEFLWDYNIYKTSEKILLYHYDLYKYPHNKFTIFRMEPSFKYRTIMYSWKNNYIQRRLMIKEKCHNYFSIINKEI